MSQKPNASGRLSAVRCRGLRASLSDAWKIYVVNYKVFSLFLLPYLLLAGLGAALLSYIFMNVVCGYFLPASYLDLTASVSGMVVVFSSIKYSDWIQLFMSAITFGVAFYLLEGAAAVQLRFYKAIDSMPRQQKGFSMWSDVRRVAMRLFMYDVRTFFPWHLICLLAGYFCARASFWLVCLPFLVWLTGCLFLYVGRIALSVGSFSALSLRKGMVRNHKFRSECLLALIFSLLPAWGVVVIASLPVGVLCLTFIEEARGGLAADIALVPSYIRWLYFPLATISFSVMFYALAMRKWPVALRIWAVEAEAGSMESTDAPAVNS